MAKIFGVPRHGLRVEMVTDSQASIDVLRKCDKTIGIKDVLGPEMDAALAVAASRKKPHRSISLS